MTLREITRRHFFQQSGFGIGCARRSRSLLERRSRPGRRSPARTSRPSQEHHLSVHGGRAVAARPVRSQAEAAAARRPAHSRKSSSKGSASPSSKARRSCSGRPTVRTPRAVAAPSLGAAAAPGEDRRRHRHRPVAAHDAVQSRARPDLHEHRPASRRPAEHGLVADLRAREREPRPARLRRAALRRERAGRRQVVLGQRIPADGLSGRRVPVEGRSGAVRVESRRASTARRAARRSTCMQRSEPARTVPTSAIRRSPRASPPTRWRIACRRACPS